MANTISIRDSGAGNTSNSYRLEFENEPQKSTVNDATINSNDLIKQLSGGRWVVYGKVYGGTDSFEYTGSREAMSFEYPGRISLRINDKDWMATDKFGEVRPWETNAGPAPDPTEPPKNDGRTAVDLSGIDSDEAIGGGTFHDVGPNEEPQDGFVSRYQTTVRDQTIQLDENDSGAVQRAVNRLPYNIDHNITFDFSDGDHTGNGSSVRTGAITLNSRGRLYLEGNGHGSTRVACGLNGVYSGKQEHNKVRGIHWDGLSQFSGPVDLRDCRFSGFSKPGANSTGTAAVSGKNGLVHAKNCIFGEPTDDYGIWSTLQERYSLTACTLRGKVLAVNNAPDTHATIQSCSMDAPRFMESCQSIRSGFFVGGRQVA